MQEKTEWILCPICGNKTKTKVRSDTMLKRFPLFCPKCRRETTIDFVKMNMTVIKEPDALDAEPMKL